MCPVTRLPVLCEHFRYSEDLNRLAGIQVSLLNLNKCLLEINVVDVVWLRIQKYTMLLCFSSIFFLNVHHKVNYIHIWQVFCTPSCIYIESLLYPVLLTGFLKSKLRAVLSKYPQTLPINITLEDILIICFLLLNVYIMTKHQSM